MSKCKEQQIQKIQEQSQMLMEANKVISKIASETNLLSMNDGKNRIEEYRIRRAGVKSLDLGKITV